MPRLNSSRIYVLLAECLFAGVVVAMGLFVQMSLVGILGLTLLSLVAVFMGLDERTSRSGLVVGWACTFLFWGYLLLLEDAPIALGSYCSSMALLVAVAVLLATWRLVPGSLRSHWRILGMTWGGLASFGFLAIAYLLNQSAEFYLGLLFSAALLIACKFLFRLPNMAVQAVNTFLLLLIGLPVADAIVRPNYQFDEDLQSGRPYYSYDFARKNPTAFAHWWNHFVAEWFELQKSICMPDHHGLAPFLLKPGTEGMMFGSRVHINKLGFRGPELPQPKGNAYRIVALGESTTFGHTINADDVPWPRVLERMICERLKSNRPVQVINAGIPSYTIRLNVDRLAEQILPLEPDMIISYHGYNGFMWLNAALPPTHGKGPPPYVERPLKLLADAEYRLKMMAYRHHRSASVVTAHRVPEDPMDTEYAQGYEDLFHVALTNRIHLVLANYSMAVNAGSDPDVINFYRLAFPQVLSQIRANRVHSGIVQKLAAEHPEICLVDTHPGLDGERQEFIDLVHFTQEGREQMAETMFESIAPILKRDLAVPEPVISQ